MKLTLQTRERDLGLNKLKLTIQQLSSKPSVKVGVVGEQASEDRGGITLSELAAVHEYGSPKRGIPERSFIRSTLDAKKALITKELGKGLGNILSGTTTSLAVLQGLGDTIAHEVQSRIDRGLAPPLKDPHKSGFRPLIDTGDLVLSIGSEVTLDGRHIE